MATTEKIRLVVNPRPATEPPPADDLAPVQAFYRSLPDYAPTPLAALDHLAGRLGVHRLWVKDEGRRFGLKAFKALGATYALCRALAARLALDAGPPTLEIFRRPDVRNRLAAVTCITATDGNHGRAVAWAARRLGCRAVVYMPRGTAAARVENVRMFDATVTVIDGTYDDAVARAAADAARNGWLLVQDTAWEGYEEIPRWIMQGYRVLAEECFDQIGDRTPTHAVVQAGVGSFAAAMVVSLLAQRDGGRTRIVVVEPTRAACFYESMAAGDGRPRPAADDLDTIMAGLACGVPSTLAWEVLRRHAHLFVACPDRVARRGMRVLGNPLEGDPAVVSGESGAVGLGLIYEALTDPDCMELKRSIGLDADSRVLVFSTEADTDPAMYRRVVWG